MALHRTEFNRDLYPQAGNMDWIRSFAESSLEKEAQKALGMNQVKADFEALINSNVDIEDAKNQIIQKYDPDGIYNIRQQLDQWSTVDETGMVPEGIVDAEEVTETPGDTMTSTPPATPSEMDRIDSIIRSSNKFDEIQKRLDTKVTNLQKAIETIKATIPTEENKRELEKFNSQILLNFDALLPFYTDIKGNLQQIQTKMTALSKYKGAKTNEDIKKQAGVFSDLWNKLRGNNGKKELPIEEVNSIITSVNEDYKELLNNINYVSNQGLLAEDTEGAALLSEMSKKIQAFQAKKETLTEPTTKTVPTDPASTTVPTPTDSTRPAGEMGEGTGKVSPSKGGGGGGTYSVSPDMMSLFDPASKDINYEQIEKYQNMVLSILRQTANKLSLEPEEMEAMNTRIESISKNFVAIAKIVSDSQARKKAPKSITEPVPESTTEPEQTSSTPEPIPASKGSELEEVGKERSPFFK